MKYIFILLATFAIYSCRKVSDTPPSSRIQADKSKIVFDMFHMRDTVTIDAPGPWEVSSTPSVPNDISSLMVSRMQSDSSKIVLSVLSQIYDGKDMHGSLRIKMVNSPDTTPLDVPISYLATPRDTFAFGGEGDDEFNAAITRAGVLTIVGYSESSRVGDANNHGGKDIWIKQMNRFGHSIWDRLIGGSADDVATCIIDAWTRAGGTSRLAGYLIGGYTYSNDGDVLGNHGSKDAWLVKIDSVGNVVWQKTLGTSNDEDIKQISSLSDGNMLISGTKNGDQWMCKIDNDANVIWERTFGSSSIDEAGSFTETENAYYFTGSGKTADGDIADKPTSSVDAWLVSLSKETGDILWKGYVGGAGEDRGVSAVNLFGEQVYIVGTTESGDIFPDFSGTRNVFLAAFERWNGDFVNKNIIKNTDWDDVNGIGVTRGMQMFVIGKSRRPNFEGSVEDSYDGLITVDTHRLIGGDRADEIKTVAWGDFNQILLIGTTSSYATADGKGGKNGWFSWLNQDW